MVRILLVIILQTYLCLSYSQVYHNSKHYEDFVFQKCNGRIKTAETKGWFCLDSCDCGKKSHIKHDNLYKVQYVSGTNRYSKDFLHKDSLFDKNDLNLDSTARLIQKEIQIFFWYITTYDSLGRLSKVNILNKDSSKLFEREYFYKKNNLSCIIYYNTNHEFYQMEKFVYNKKNKVLERFTIDKKGIKRVLERNTYYNNGLLKIHDLLTYKKECYTYNDSNKIETYELYEEHGLTKVEHEYSKNTETIKSNFYPSNNSFKGVTTYFETKIFGDKNRIIEYKFDSPASTGGTKKTYYTYNNDLLISERNIDIGCLVTTSNEVGYKYDHNKNIIIVYEKLLDRTHNQSDVSWISLYNIYEYDKLNNIIKFCEVRPGLKGYHSCFTKKIEYYE